MSASSFRLLRFFIVAALSILLLEGGSAAQTRYSYSRGQTITPAYEGWWPNDDGSFTMFFGYMNSNWEERVRRSRWSRQPHRARRTRSGPTHPLLSAAQHVSVHDSCPEGFRRQGARLVSRAAQGLTGSLTGKVRDEQGAAIQGATVRLSSPALIGGPATLLTNENGQLRFPVLLPGVYALQIEMPRFATLHDQDILIAAGGHQRQ